MDALPDSGSINFGNLEPACREEIWASAIEKNFSGGQTICREGDDCLYLPLVVSGSLRVFKSAENGREVTLYAVPPGSSCVLSAAGILKDSIFPANAVAESETRVLLISNSKVKDMYEKYPGWRNFILSLYTDRVSAVIHLVEEVLFRRLDERLWEFIKQKSVNGKLNMTHQKIAEDLGSTREVISRLLKDLENRNIIALNRGTVEIKKVR